MKRIRMLAFLLVLIHFTASTAHAAESRPLPTTEQFQALLTTCAAGAGIQIDGEIKGSIASIYDDARAITEARGFKFLTVGEFLKVLPPEDRLEGFKLYNACIVKILGGENPATDNEVPEVYELPSQLTTYGKPLHIRAKTLLAKDSEIRAFPAGYSPGAGTPGANGANGSNGRNGSGEAAANGTDGGAGGAGPKGPDAGLIRIEAEQLIGKLRIINSGSPGGTGGRGANGGNGGKGGNGRSGASGMFDCSRGPGSGGSGGDAGSGGDGGPGGDGGNAGAVVVDLEKVEPGSRLIILAESGAGGNSGAPGAAGRKGPGGPRGGAPGLCSGGGATSGADGAVGQAGRALGDGRSGSDAQIEVSIGGRIEVVTGTYSRTFE